MNGRELGLIVREALIEAMTDRVPRLGAALAFYATFALAPLLVLVIALAGLVYGTEAAAGRLLGEMRSLVGEEGANALQAMVAAAGHSGASFWASCLGGLALLLGATGLFVELQDALNTIWHVQPKQCDGWCDAVRSRFLSFVLVLGSAFLLVVSLSVNAALSAFAERLEGSQNVVNGQVVNFIISFGVITGLFAMVYRVLPDTVIAWRDVWLGAAITSLLFGIGKYLIGLYLGRTALTSTYGAAASFAVLLLWNYYAAQVFLFGAELTKVYAGRGRRGIVLELRSDEKELSTSIQRTSTRTREVAR